MIITLRAAENRMQTLIEGLPGTAYERTLGSDGTHRMEVFGPELAEICGWPAWDRIISPERFDALIHPSDREKVIRARRESARSMTMMTVVFRIVRADGGVRWVKDRSSPRQLENGEVRWTGLIADWSRQVEAESESGKLTEFLRVALRASRFGVWRHNLLTGEREWDDRMFELYGRSKRESLPSLEAPFERVPAADRTVTAEFWNRLRGGESLLEVSHRFARDDGVERHGRLYRVILTWVNGRPEWVAGLQADVTEEVEADAQRERLGRQLQESQRLETLGTLAGGVAHDFNNLLTVIAGFAELARNELPSTHRARSAIEETLRASRAAAALVQQLLLFARKGPAQELRPIDLAGLTRESARLIAASFPPEITLKLEIGNDVPPVVGDLSRLQQVVMNLCVNAGQAIGDRTGSVTVAVGVAEQPEAGARWDAGTPTAKGRWVRLAVSDTGDGMTEAVRRRIFEPFFTTKEVGKGKGTGLGLSIVHGVVVELGGGIRVRSEEGKGTTFEVFFPLAAEEMVAAVPSVRPPQQGAGEPVLVVDDDEVVAYFAAEAVKIMGFTAETASGGAQALERLRTGPENFALLVLDYAMPGMTGAEFIRAARELKPGLPVILMSGDLARADLEWMGKLPRARMLQKPFSINDLMAVAGKLVGPGALVG